MFSLKQAAILALVGTAFAAPLAHRHRDDQSYDYPHVGRLPSNFGYEIDGNTVIPVDGQPTGTDFAGYTVITIYPDAATPAPTTSAPQATVTATYSSSSSDDSSSTSTPSQSGGTGNYMSVVSKWRSAGGLKQLTQDSTLEANALKTVTDGHGQMKHELNPGSMAQVLAPGSTSDFEHVYVGGWLCEISSLPGLNGICATEGQGWSHDGQTGHAEILTDPKYSKIGCALNDGIWGCDLA